MSTNQTKEINAIKAVVDAIGSFKKEEKIRILRFSGELSDSSVESSVSTTSTMELLFQIFKDSIEEINSDKEHWLEQLNEHQKIGEALGDYLSGLAGSLMPEYGDGCNNDSENEVEVKSLAADLTKKLGLYEQKTGAL